MTISLDLIGPKPRPSPPSNRTGVHLCPKPLGSLLHPGMDFLLPLTKPAAEWSSITPRDVIPKSPYYDIGPNTTQPYLARSLDRRHIDGICAENF